MAADHVATEACLADVSPSAAAAIGIPGFVDTLGLGACRHVVVCLIDGLGWESLQRHADDSPMLAAMGGGAIRAVFPTTTPVGLGSLGTGLLPGAHGLVGAAFEYPETGELLSPLSWGVHPPPVAVQPEPTVFERVARAGATMTTVSPGAYRESGLTRAVLRGADYLPADDIDERVAGLAGVLSTAERSFTYVYWPELDRIGHEFGVASQEWRDALRRADGLVERLVQVLVPGTTLVVTSDHGMVDCPNDRRIEIEANPLLTAGVRRVAGEPRARHLYVTPGAASDVQAAWQQVLGADALVLRRTELVDGGYFGNVDPGLVERIGDVMAIPRDNVMLASRVDATVSQLIGQHGGLTADEVRIPALIHRVP